MDVTSDLLDPSPRMSQPGSGLIKLSPHLYLYPDTCNVYVLCSGRQAALVDFGSGEVLDHLAEIGVDQVTDVFMTHHHRDQGQGLPECLPGSRWKGDFVHIWAPETEQDLFHSIDAHWQGREVYNNYNVRQDRFSLLQPAPVSGLLQDYACLRAGEHSLQVIPTPGHTPGSVTLGGEIDGMHIFFTGDLIAGPGKVWSLSATQWTYNGGEGIAASLASLLDLKDRNPDVLLPSHGSPMSDPGPAIDLLADRLWALLQQRGHNPRLKMLRDHPYENITPHLLFHRASLANTYVLLSASGKALLIDFGYDFATGQAAGSDRASRRPWLYTLPALKRQYGVTKIDVVVPTHYHDDHVGGCNLLRRVEGTQVWAAENFAPILEQPSAYDLPCLWYDPIPVDRCLPLGEPIPWEEYTLTLYPLPGHTLYAAAVVFEVDGKRVLAAGDQYQEENSGKVNYVYQNRYQIGDYIDTARLYSQLKPDLILPGHGPAFWTTSDYFEKITHQAEAIECLQYDLLPEAPDLGAEGFLARLYPYQALLVAGEPAIFEVSLRNPFLGASQAEIQVAAPEGWQVENGRQSVRLSGLAAGQVPGLPPMRQRGRAAIREEKFTFRVCPPPGLQVRRARIAVDITINGHRFGQQAEALVSVTVQPAQGLLDN